MSAALELWVKPFTDMPANSTACATPGCFSADLGDAPRDRLGAIERGGRRQLRDRDQVLLVLRRDEARPARR